MSFIYHQPTTSVTAPLSTHGMLNSGVSITVPNSSLNSTYVSVTGSNGMSYDDLKPKSIVVQGQAQFDADVEVKGNISVKGVDLAEAIKNIEARLNILRPNHKLEQEWDELRELGERYRQMERDMLEKLELVETLKQEY